VQVSGANSEIPARESATQEKGEVTQHVQSETASDRRKGDFQTGDDRSFWLGRHQQLVRGDRGSSNLTT